MRYRVECLDRQGGKPYIAEFEASSPEAAVRIAEMSGHQAVRTLGGPETVHAAAAPARVDAPVLGPVPATPPLDRKAVASLSLGVLSLVAFCLPLLGFPVALVGLALGLASPARVSSIRTAGIVTSSVGLALSILNAVAGVLIQMNGGGLFGKP